MAWIADVAQDAVSESGVLVGSTDADGREPSAFQRKVEEIARDHAESPVMTGIPHPEYGGDMSGTAE